MSTDYRIWPRVNRGTEGGVDILLRVGKRPKLERVHLDDREAWVPFRTLLEALEPASSEREGQR